MKQYGSVEEAQAELNTWDGVNKYLANQARKFLSQVKVSGVKVEKVVGSQTKSEGNTLMTKEEAFALNRDEQIALLEKLGVEKIPRYEKDRVALLLRLKAKK